jgi:hypothetical protein
MAPAWRTCSADNNAPASRLTAGMHQIGCTRAGFHWERHRITSHRRPTMFGVMRRIVVRPAVLIALGVVVVGMLFFR